MMSLRRVVLWDIIFLHYLVPYWTMNFFLKDTYISHGSLAAKTNKP